MPLVIHHRVSYLSIISNSLSPTTQTVILHYLSARLMSVTPSYIRKMSHLSVHFVHIRFTFQIKLCWWPWPFEYCFKTISMFCGFYTSNWPNFWGHQRGNQSVWESLQPKMFKSSLWNLLTWPLWRADMRDILCEAWSRLQSNAFYLRNSYISI